MPRFPSAEWMDEFCDHLEAQEEIGDVARALDGVYRFVIEPAGPVHERHVYDVDIGPDGTGGATATRVDDNAATLAGLDAATAPRREHDAAATAPRRDADAADPRLTLTATYDRWRQLITGRLDIGMAIMLRRLKVSGDLRALTRDVQSAKPLMDALGSVDTDWPDE